MMLGVVAANGVPADAAVAAASLNFAAGTYVVNGVSVAAADVVDQPGLITANGLEVPDNTASAVIDYINDVLALLVAGEWTVVIEYESLWDTGTEVLLVVSNAGADQFLQLYRNEAPNPTRIGSTETGDTQYREAIDPTARISGIHRVALTTAASRLSISVNGGTVVSDTSAMDATFTRAVIGGYTFDDKTENEFYLRSIDIYAALPDADLPALSA